MKRRLSLSISAGLVFGFGLFLLSFCAGRKFAAQFGRDTTILELKAAKSQVLAYQQKYGKLPRTLEEAGDTCIDRNSISCGAEDAYGFPLDYEVHGSTFTITALGRDGEPGGWGMEEDISTDDLPHLSPNAGQMNLYDYFDQGNRPSDPFGDTGRHDAIALSIAGLAMSLFCFLFYREADWVDRAFFRIAGKLIAAAVSTIALIFLILILHII